MTSNVSLNLLIENMKLHQTNRHEGHAQVFVSVDGVGTFPLSGGVSTYRDGSDKPVVVLFAASPPQESDETP